MRISGPCGFNKEQRSNKREKVDMIMREWRRKDKEFNKSTIEVNLLLKDHHEMEPETDHQENIQRVLKCLNTMRDMLDLFKDS
ncbi:hypothetical protein ACOSQ3_022991 [Xanthoceras sorbifolium]